MAFNPVQSTQATDEGRTAVLVRNVSGWATRGWVWFLVSSALFLVYSIHVGDVPYYYDSGGYVPSAHSYSGEGGYWPRPDGFQHDGHFSLTAWPSALRTYLLPLSYEGLRRACHLVHVADWVGFKVCSSLTFGLFTAVLLPRLLERWTGRKARPWQRLLLLVAIVFFWRGYVLYPMSDVVSVALLLGSLLAASSPDWFPARRLVGFSTLAAGLGMASALVRPGYQVSFAVVLAVVLVRLIRTRRAAWIPVAVVASAAVVAALAAPQVVINNHYGRPLNPLAPRNGDGTDPYIFQLDSGFFFQKYETVVAAPDFHPGGLAVRDVSGETLAVKIRQCCGNPAGADEPYSRQQYLRFVRSNPGQMLALYARHAFNGLDVWHPTPYLSHVHPSKWFRAANYLTWFFAVWCAALLISRRRQLLVVHWAALSLVALVAPVVLALPGAVETRFFLPLQIAAYLVVAAGLPQVRLALAAHTTRRAVCATACAGAWVLLGFATSGAALDNLRQ